MKKFLVAVFIFILFACPAYGANTHSRSCLTGGTSGCLDAIDGTNLQDGDKAYVITSGEVQYPYRLDASSGAAESSPDIISPDANAGNKRWILVDLEAANIGTTDAGSIVTIDDTQTLSGKSFTQTGTIMITDTGSVGNREPLKLLASSLAGGGFARFKLGRADSNYNAADFAFYYNSDGSTSNRLGLGVIGAENALRIDGLGNVGIGKTSAGAELDVDGEVEATSLDINGPADISGTTNLDNVDIDGTFNLGGTTLSATIAEVNAATDGIGVTIPKTYTFEIGDWDMDADATKSVSLITGTGKVRSITVVIRSDTGVEYHFPYFDSSGVLQGWHTSYSGISVTLRRTASGTFDSTSFDSTSYNRGWLTYSYVD